MSEKKWLKLLDLCRENPAWAAEGLYCLEQAFAAEIGDESKFDDWWCTGDDGGCWFLKSVPEPYIVSLNRYDDSIGDWWGWEWDISGEKWETIGEGKAPTAIKAMQAAKMAWEKFKKEKNL